MKLHRFKDGPQRQDISLFYHRYRTNRSQLLAGTHHPSRFPRYRTIHKRCQMIFGIAGVSLITPEMFYMLAGHPDRLTGHDRTLTGHTLNCQYPSRVSGLSCKVHPQNSIFQSYSNVMCNEIFFIAVTMIG